jgi:hypothetical protein
MLLKELGTSPSIGVIKTSESGIVAGDDRIDAVSHGSRNTDVLLEIRAAPFDGIAKDVASSCQYLRGRQAR